MNKYSSMFGLNGLATKCLRVAEIEY